MCLCFLGFVPVFLTEDVLIVLKLVLLGIVVLMSFALVLLILLHKGRGGGLSDMFGGGITVSFASSGVAERNLNRLTVMLALLWGVTIITLSVLARFRL
ncbi:preprotein translocase subunit SecG [Tropheryma whipplei]|uniref:preprotein translocase subunit SecG n=1 Tax=Tropheryma whipplei TaxID=2039 RepID=UPI0004B053ED|nr:preprotein translocase subunit SecG [Tropheryma whipplei]